jgi:asparagine N-glycosylation enzyme membrane subunit Stt3
MRRAADIVTGIIAGVTFMLAAIAWADGNSLISFLIGIIAMLMVALYAISTKDSQPVKRTRVTYGNKAVIFPPENYEEVKP